MARTVGVRGWIVFSVGIAGIIYETLDENQDRPWLLAVFAAMAGVPAAAVGDQFVRLLSTRKGDDEADP